MAALFTAYSLSGAAGIRNSWVMLVVAWSVHFGYLHPPASLEWVGSWWLILLAVAGSIVEFFGDKVPALDHALHALHMGLAPLVGALAAMSGYQGDGAVEVILGVLGGANALVIHSARSGVRAVSSATTVGMANPVISILEDIAATVFIIVALFAPLLTAALLVMATIWMIKKARGLWTRRQTA